MITPKVYPVTDINTILFNKGNFSFKKNILLIPINMEIIKGIIIIDSFINKRIVNIDNIIIKAKVFATTYDNIILGINNIITKNA